MAFITRKVVKGPGGRPHVVFVNTQTGEEIPFDQIGQHTLIEHGTDIDFQTPSAKPSQEKTEEVLSEDEGKRFFEDGGSVHDDPDYYSSQFGGERNISSNFGYMSKPEALGLLGMIPGVGGLIGKSINAGINLNNTLAVNQAREFMGFEPMSPVDIAKGVAMGNKGYIGDMVVGDKQYAVGFEAKTEDGRTTLTLNEANARATKAALQGIEAREATEEEVQQAAKEHQEEFGKERSGGLLGPVKDAVRSVTDPIGQAVRSVTDPIGKGLTGRAPSAQPTRATPTAQPGRGLASLAPNGLIDPSGLSGKGRGVAPNTDLQQALGLAVANTFGPGYQVSMQSGTYSPARQASIDAKMGDLAERGISPTSDLGKAELEQAGQIGSTRHSHGKALDFDVIGPSGRVTDTKQLNELAAEMGRQGISSVGHGLGNSYMGQGRIHADVHSDRVPHWGNDKAFARSFMSERTPVGILPFENIPIPQPLDRVQEVEVPSAVPMGYVEEAKKSAAQTAIENMIRDDVENPADGRGIPQEVLNEMVVTIAGELGSQTIAGIRSGDPNAIATAKDEIANIGHTMVNRSRADPRGGWVHVTDPSQYNSRMPGKMGTTRQNIGLVGDFISQTLGEFNSGGLTGSAPNATHYHANYMTPSWAGSKVNEIRSGEHTFSNVNQRGTNVQEYRPAVPNVGPVPDSRPDASSSGVGLGGDSTGFGGGSFGGIGGGGYGEPGGSSPGFGGGSSGSGGIGSSGGVGGSGGSGGSGSKGGGSSGSSGSGGFAPGGSGGGAFGDAPGAGGSGGSSIGGGIGLGSVGSGGASGNSSGVGSAGQAGFGGMNAGSLGGSASGLGSGYGSVGSGGAQSGFSGSGGTGGSGNNNQGGFTVDITYDKDVGGSSGDGGGDKVICGYFYGKGKIPKKIYLGDLKYSRDIAHHRTKTGYQLWAVPLVKWLDRKPSRPIIDTLLFPFTKGWVYEMAWRVGFTKERSLWGRIVTPVVSGMCYTLGFIKEKIYERF